ncbi:hypothetical protein CW713_05220 [Methanophagales archaeon]|nr:MAG: hypothetical protein CW713_05220 [Methanophagales archaeon]
MGEGNTRGWIDYGEGGGGVTDSGTFTTVTIQAIIHLFLYFIRIFLISSLFKFRFTIPKYLSESSFLSD